MAMGWDELVHEAVALAEYARRRKAARDAAGKRR